VENPDIILSDIQKLASGRLHFPDELEALVRASAGGERWQDVLALSFHAKFLVRASEVMKRIGSQGEGYDKLSAEFSVQMETAQALLLHITELIPEMKASFEYRFLGLRALSLQNFLSFMQDVSWIKNREIDNRNAR
jgi:hypothetical protein